MTNETNVFTLERKESYFGRCTPTIEWIVRKPDGKIAQYFNRKKDAIKFIDLLNSITKKG
jgi:hypothetical protein